MKYLVRAVVVAGLLAPGAALQAQADYGRVEVPLPFEVGTGGATGGFVLHPAPGPGERFFLVAWLHASCEVEGDVRVRLAGRPVGRLTSADSHFFLGLSATPQLVFGRRQASTVGRCTDGTSFLVRGRVSAPIVDAAAVCRKDGEIAVNYRVRGYRPEAAPVQEHYDFLLDEHQLSLHVPGPQVVPGPIWLRLSVPAAVYDAAFAGEHAFELLTDSFGPLQRISVELPPAAGVERSCGFPFDLTGE